jgi:tetratricopeptide (TPR) repeat protein
MRNLLPSAITSAIIALGSSVPAAAQDTTDQQLGQVNFETSCNEVAQRRFDRAMRYQHSFWYRAAIEIFEEALKADPACAIAHWGIALAMWNNPHNPPPASNQAPALAAIQKAQAIGAKSQRERDYIDALALLYTDYDKSPYRTRLVAYLKAMEALAQRYPQDDEAQIAYAITLQVSALPTDKTYAQQAKGAAILEPISQRLPQHPGVTHYLIHLYDYPTLANKGLDAANRYAKIAPNAPHAQHMPSHIYTRVGYWKESVASNLAAANAAQAHKESSDLLHARDYVVYAYLQLAQDDKARAMITDMAAVEGVNPAVQAPHFARAASPARYVIERGDWTGAMALEVKPSRFAFIDAITHFARALGAARAGQPAAAKADIAKLVEFRDSLRKANNAYWAEQVDIQWQVASAWVLFAEGKHDEALRMMSAAADVEDKTEKSPVTPGPIAPARELYGYMLLERGMAREALNAFESTQRKEPNRYHGYAGAAQAAERLGDKAKAKANYEKLIALAGGTFVLASNAAVARPELIAARKYLAGN